MKIYVFFENPKQISFEDDILHIISAFIRYTDTITPAMWELFARFPLVLEKNKHQFQDLFYSINLFLNKGKEQLVMNPEAIRVAV